MEEENRCLHQQVSSFMSDVVSVSITVSLFLTHQQVKQLEEEKAHSQQMAEQQTRELEEENRDLHRQVQQLQEQVSSVVFHHTCAVCGVCRWLLLCPHTHS